MPTSSLLTPLPQPLRELIAREVLRVAIPVVLAAAALSYLAIVFFAPDRSGLPVYIAVIGSLVAAWLAHRGHACPGTSVLLITLVAVAAGAMWRNGGVEAYGYEVCIALAVLVVTVHGPRWAVIYLLAVTALGAAALYARWRGWLGPPPVVRPVLQWLMVSVFTCVAAFFSYVSIVLMRRAIQERDDHAAQLVLARDAEQVRSREFQAVFNQTFQLMGLLDLQGRLVQVNATALGVIAVDPATVVGKPFADSPWWSEQDRARLISAMTRCAGGERVRFQTTVIRADRSERIIDFSLSPLRAEADRVVMMIAEGRDITELVETEARLHRAEKIATMGEFAGGVAHDFNNLLTGVMGYAELISLRTADPQLREYAQRIIQTTTLGRDLTSGLMRFARQGLNEAVRFDVHETVRAAVALFKAARGRRLTTDISLQAASSIILGWPAQIQSTVLNLCMNAADAMPGGGTISIATAAVQLGLADCMDFAGYELRPGPMLRLSVSDSGTGMSPEVLERCLVPFYSTKGELGTGLGLASVQGAVRGHLGALRITSTLGRGTTCTLWLPLTLQAAGLDQDPVSGQPPAHPLGGPVGTKAADGRRSVGPVIIVDDDPVIRGSLCESLERAGYLVIALGDGEAAVRWCQEHVGLAAALLLDVDMPRMSGLEAAQILRHLDPALPLVLVSGSLDQRMVDQALADGLVGVLHKPVFAEALVALIRRCARSMVIPSREQPEAPLA